MNSIENEIWKDIPGYEGSYQASSLGRIKSLKRYSNINRLVNEKILKECSDGKGYFIVNLCSKAIIKKYFVHQLVAMAFLGHTRCKYKFVINHIDFNSKNNKLNNLEIVTQRENANKKHIDSSSVFTGVCFNKLYQNWQSHIYIKPAIVHLGTFDTEIEASEYYQNALESIKNGTEIKVKRNKYSSEYKGVSFNKKRNKWLSQISVNYITKNLGRYDTEIDAHLAYQRALSFYRPKVSLPSQKNESL